ncbi:hypothetical protein KTS45_12345 [Halomicroarcula limicola]|uniref:Lipoprotein n=1 Tax=Haloarcula limicola TaxID=1429915 RepID=A0A8J8C452_9EURY|nr:hypothetical protein [Halomicroarcula limicola]MBV0924987.1 hypothetical protein [Halomicroarcula limicola]
MRLRPVALAALFVLAGCSGFAASDRTEAVTPAPVPDAEPGATGVPGLTNDSVNPAILAQAHRNALDDQSYTLTVHWDASGREWETRLGVEDERRYRYLSTQTTGAYSDRLFVEGDVRYSRHRRPLGIQYRRNRSVPASERFGHHTGRLVETYLPTGPVAVRQLGGGYLVVADRAPATFDRVRNYTVRATVASSGWVRTFSVRYFDPYQDVSVRYRFEYSAIGETTVERPAWVEERWPDDFGRETATPAMSDDG